MPVRLNVVFTDGTNRQIKMPAEIWRRTPKKVSRLIMSKSDIASIELDPNLESADTDRHNNFWPPKPKETRFQLFKSKKSKNPMQEANDEANRDQDVESDDDKEKPEAIKKGE